jgi:uncharacterized protein YkwD
MAAGVLTVTATTAMAAGFGTPAAAAQPTTVPTSYNSPAQQVLRHINAVRAAVGARPLALRTGLNSSARGHNRTMSSGCGLSHQCYGEASPSRRASAQGVAWRAFAENIGYGRAGATEAAKAAMAVRLTRSMIAESAPNNGHRRNILDPRLGQIGIDVYRDASGKVWLTQDFTN